jgi:hypothetical protein
MRLPGAKKPRPGPTTELKDHYLFREHGMALPERLASPPGVLHHDRARATGKGVLDGVDLSIGEGETFALPAPNGAGRGGTGDWVYGVLQGLVFPVWRGIEI